MEENSVLRYSCNLLFSYNFEYMDVVAVCRDYPINFNKRTLQLYKRENSIS